MGTESLSAATEPIPLPVQPGTPGTHAPAPLPPQRRLRELLTRTQYPHLGYFESPGDSLPQALEQLVARGARLLGRDSSVLVTECGLGGAVHQLAALGHRAVGLDRDPATIALARARASSPRARFLASSLEDFATRARGARIDALFLFEALGARVDLGAFLQQARDLLRPGGLVVVHEIVRHPAFVPTPAARLAFGALRAAADTCGFDLLEARDLSNRTAPTLSRLLRQLVERRAELVRQLGPTGAEELARAEQELRAAERGFTQQELFYESTLLRLGARFAHDSVVLRPRKGG